MLPWVYGFGESEFHTSAQRSWFRRSAKRSFEIGSNMFPWLPNVNTEQKPAKPHSILAVRLQNLLQDQALVLQLFRVQRVGSLRCSGCCT